MGAFHAGILQSECAFMVCHTSSKGLPCPVMQHEQVHSSQKGQGSGLALTARCICARLRWAACCSWTYPC